VFKDDHAIFYRTLSTLLGTGLPVPMALRAAAEGTRSRRFRDAVGTVTYHTGAGTSIAESMAFRPETFDPGDIALVEAGERTGTLGATLLRLAVDRDRVGGLRRKMMAGLAYPVLLYHLAATIPPFPKLILEGFQAWIRPVLLLIVPFWAVIGVLVVLGRTRSGRERRRRLLGMLPFCGTILKRGALSRFLRVLASAMDAGMAAHEAISVAAGATTDIRLRAAAERGRAVVSDGGDFGTVFAGVPGIDAAELAHLRNGEVSGELVSALREVAAMNEERVDGATDAALRYLPVTMYLAVAAYIAYTVISTYAKMYSKIL